MHLVVMFLLNSPQEEGKTLKIDIDYTDTDYKVMVSKTSEKLPNQKDDWIK